jgi:two-component system, NarL family, sensor kinase
VKSQFLVFCIFFSFSYSFSQPFEINDSLKNVIFKQRNENSIDALNFLAKDNFRTNVRFTKFYAQWANRIAEKLEYPKGIAEANSNLALFYLMTGKFDSAIFFLDKTILFAEEISDKPLLANAFNYKGVVFFNLDDLEAASNYFTKSLEIRVDMEQLEEVLKLRYNIASIAMKSGQYEKALENFLELLIIDEERGDSSAIASDLNNIGLIYLDKKQYDEAEVFFQRCLGITTIDKLQKANCFLNLSSVEIGRDHYIGAEDYANKSLTLFQDLKYNNGISRCINNLGICSENTGEYKKALEFYLKSIEIKSQFHDNSDLSSTLGNIGSVYFKMRDLKKAKEFLEKSNEIALVKENLTVLRNNYEKLVMVCALLQDFSCMENSSAMYSKFNETIYNLESARNMVEMQTKYETEKKEQLIQIKNLEIEQQKEKGQRQLFLSASLIGLLVVSSLWFYNHNRLKQKTILEQEVNRQQKLRFKAVIDAQEKEKVRIAKELHDGVGQVLAGIKLKLTNDINTDKDAISLLNNASDEIRTISHQMMPNALIRLGLPDALQELFKSLENQRIKFDYESFSLPKEIPQEIAINVYRIAQEISSNIIKHSKADKALFNLYSSGNILYLMAEDNGQGMGASDKKGIGLSNMISRAESMGGNINFESPDNGGTIVKLAVPLKQV